LGFPSQMWFGFFLFFYIWVACIVIRSYIVLMLFQCLCYPTVNYDGFLKSDWGQVIIKFIIYNMIFNLVMQTWASWVVCLICGLFWACFSPVHFVCLPRKLKETRRFKIVVSQGCSLKICEFFWVCLSLCWFGYDFFLTLLVIAKIA
jgi:hypothetical protein